MRHKRVEHVPVIYTSYFSKIMRGDIEIELKSFSIARSHPPGWRGKVYLPLAPSEGLLSIKRNIKNYPWESYVNAYRRETLNRLDPQKVYEDIGGEGAVLVCWEGIFKPCHRRIVGLWLEESLNIKVVEL